MGMLNTIAPSSSQKASAKGAAKAKPKAKQAAKPATKSATRATTSSAAEPPSKKARVAKDPVAPMTAPSKKRKTSNDAAGEPNLFQDAADGEMTEADQKIVETFGSKLGALMQLDPPLADAPFKANLTDVMSKVSSIRAELKVKKRSAGRRSMKEEDPLFKALAAVEARAERFVYLLKCA